MFRPFRKSSNTRRTGTWTSSATWSRCPRAAFRIPPVCWTGCLGLSGTVPCRAARSRLFFVDCSTSSPPGGPIDCESRRRPFRRRLSDKTSTCRTTWRGSRRCGRKRLRQWRRSRSPQFEAAPRCLCHWRPACSGRSCTRRSRLELRAGNSTKRGSGKTATSRKFLRILKKISWTTQQIIRIRVIGWNKFGFLPFDQNNEMTFFQF